MILSVAVENNHQFARPNILLVTIPCLIKSSMCHYTASVGWNRSINEELYYVTKSSVRKGRNHFHLSLTTEIKYSWARFKSQTSQEPNLMRKIWLFFFFSLSLSIWIRFGTSEVPCLKQTLNLQVQLGNLHFLGNVTKSADIYYSFKIFPRFWLAKSTRCLHPTLSTIASRYVLNVFHFFTIHHDVLPQSLVLCTSRIKFESYNVDTTLAASSANLPVLSCESLNWIALV